MSEAIFPSFPGLTWDVSKTPEFFSLSKTSPTGVDVSASLGAYPRWHFSLAYEFLKDREDEATNELHRLLGFFLQRHGSVDDFLFLDPTDNAVLTPQIFYSDFVVGRNLPKTPAPEFVLARVRTRCALWVISGAVAIFQPHGLESTATAMAR